MENEEKRFGKYVLLSRLAAGGMAVTYRAKMTAAAGLTKDVVIKKIHPHLAQEEDFVEMFVHEAKLAASLTHGNIAQVFDFGKTDGDYFLAMELVHGQALSRVLRRAADKDIPFIPVPIALQIACRMCDGLHYAHTRKDEKGTLLGLVHRDVSPENTLLSYEGEVKVVDFGIAKSNAGGRQTEAGMVKGKYPYFSPEQAQAARDLDARSDVYAVGVVLYEMLCGRRPYEGEFVSVLTQLAEGKIPRPSQFNTEINGAIEQTMLKALATKRDARYQTAQQLSQALSSVLHAKYPNSTSHDLVLLLGSLFGEELAAEGNPVVIPPEFTATLMKNQQPGFGASRRAALGLKPESKATPKPIGTPPPKNATPARPRVTGTSNKVQTGSANVHGGYRPQSMPAMAPLKDKTPPGGTKLEPIEQETLLRAKARKQAEAGETRVRPQSDDRPTLPPAPRAELTLDTADLKQKRQKFVVTIGGIGGALSLLLLASLFIFGGKEEKPAEVESTELWVTTNPSGANVKVDTRELGASPVKTTVSLGPHTLLVTLAGHRPWTKRFTAKSYELVSISAKLESDLVVPEPVAVIDAGPPEVARPPSDEKHEASLPLRLFVLRPGYNALPLPKYETASVELKPGTGYQVSTEGSYSLGKGRSNSTLFYYLEGNFPENKRVGTLSPSAKLIKGATRMHVFVLDDDASDNSGFLRISLRISQYVVPQSFSFDAQKNAIVPLPEHRFVLSKLNPATRYLLTLRDDESVTASGKTGKPGYVMCLENPEKPKPVAQTHRTLEIGKRHKVTDTDSLLCVFPDTDLEDNSGSLEVDIVDMAELSPEEQAKAEKLDN